MLHMKILYDRTYVTHENITSYVRTYVAYEKGIMSEYMLHKDIYEMCSLARLVN